MDAMLRKFLHELHFDTDKAKPPDWQPDWDDAPFPFKLYKRLPVYRLSSEVPLSLTVPPDDSRPDLRTFGHFLWYTWGITQVCRAVSSTAQQLPEGASAGEWYRRTVPSGGGLYPNELYAYLKLPELPAGVYHCDAAHHRLVLLREGCFDDYLDRALGGRFRLSDAFGVLFVSVYFWKNFYKYFNFSYRLQGLDTGVLLGQLLEAGSRFGYAPHACCQFLDRAVNHLLGLAEEAESVYAVVPLAAGQPGSLSAGPSAFSLHRSSELVRELPPLAHAHDIRTRNIMPQKLPVRMNEASMQEDTSAFHPPRSRKTAEKERFPAIPLPPVEPKRSDFAALTRNRYTPETDFVRRPVSIAALARLLLSAASGPGFCDLDEAPAGLGPARRLSICGTFCGVEGLEDGAYRYDAEARVLRLLRPGDHRAWLQYGMSLPNVNLFQVPLCFHVAGDRKHGIDEWGARGYRIQQMEAGILTQRLLLAAAAEGWGGRPLLGYDAETIDDLYRLPAFYDTALIQIPVGPYRYRARWESRMHS